MTLRILDARPVGPAAPAPTVYHVAAIVTVAGQQWTLDAECTVAPHRAAGLRLLPDASAEDPGRR